MSKFYYLLLLSITSLNASTMFICTQEKHFWYEWGAATTLSIIGFILLFRSAKQSKKIANLEHKLYEFEHPTL